MRAPYIARRFANCGGLSIGGLLVSTNTQNSGTPGEGAVKVSGRGALVNFEIDDSVPLETACRELREHLGRFRELYARGEVALNVGRRMLAEEQKARIGKVVESESGLSVRQFWCDPGILEEERERIGAMLVAQARLVRQLQGDGGGESAANAADDAPAGDDDAAAPSDDAADSAADEGAECAGPPPAQLVRDTCRSGEVRRFPGSVVILGNVNPGAQVIAGGDIMVFGALRGLAHAGADGDTDASIVAMSAVKPELRIAGYSWDAGAADGSDAAALVSGDTRRGDRDAIIAAVAGDAVQVAPYLKNFGISRGVNPLEGSPAGGSSNER